MDMLSNTSLKESAYHFDSPWGAISYQWDGQQCQSVRLLELTEITPTNEDPVSLWLAAYFDQQSVEIPPLAKPKTSFQAIMRAYLCQIPINSRQTYAQCAQALHTSPRALGQALGANPFAIMIPCHRIVAQHDLGGFAYGRLWKEKLLNFEANHV